MRLTSFKEDAIIYGERNCSDPFWRIICCHQASHRVGSYDVVSCCSNLVTYKYHSNIPFRPLKSRQNNLVYSDARIRPTSQYFESMTATGFVTHKLQTTDYFVKASNNNMSYITHSCLRRMDNRQPTWGWFVGRFRWQEQKIIRNMSLKDHVRLWSLVLATQPW